MGCDIHLHSEVKIKGKWHHHSAPSIKRNYALFLKMANVRRIYNSGIAPISEPRGIPEDATELTKFIVDAWGTDGHTHSWLSAKEIAVLHDWIELDAATTLKWFDKFFTHRNMPYFMGEPLSNKKHWLSHGIEDVRYVFFFDN